MSSSFCKVCIFVFVWLIMGAVFAFKGSANLLYNFSDTESQLGSSDISNVRQDVTKSRSNVAKAALTSSNEKYTIKYLASRKTMKGAEDLPNALSVAKTPSDIVVWIGGGVQKEINVTDNLDYKSILLVPSEVKSGKNDINYTQTALLNYKIRFKWVVTEATVTSPLVAYCSKYHKDMGRLIATCQNGRLKVGNNVYNEFLDKNGNFIGKVWCFDEVGGYGSAIFTVKVAPYGIRMAKDSVDGRWFNEYTGSLYLEDVGMLTSSFYVPVNKESVAYICVTHRQQSTSEYLGVAGRFPEFLDLTDGMEYIVSLENPSDKQYVTIKENNGEITITAKSTVKLRIPVNVINKQSQKRCKFWINVHNPVTNATLKTSKFVITPKKSSRFSDIPLLLDTFDNTTTDRLSVYSSKYAVKPTDFPSLISDTKRFDSKLLTKPDGVSVKISGNNITIYSSPKASVGKYYIILVANGNHVVSCMEYTLALG